MTDLAVLPTPATALIERLEQALADGERVLVLSSRRPYPDRYAPLLVDLLERARRAQHTEVAFLSSQADGLLRLRALDQGAVAPPGDSDAGVPILRLPFEPLRRRTLHLGQCLRQSQISEGLRLLVSLHTPPGNITAEDLLLRIVSTRLLRLWGSRDVIAAPIPPHARPGWDLYAADLRIVVCARNRARPVTDVAPRALTIALTGRRAAAHIEARLLSLPVFSPPLLWTGLRWDEEQRLRVSAAASGRRTPLPPAAVTLRRALIHLERRVADLVATTLTASGLARLSAALPAVPPDAGEAP